VLGLDGEGELVSVTYLLGDAMALRPDDLHFLSILTLEAFDFIRNLLVEEVGVGRMGMYVMVVWGRLRCLRDPSQVPV